MYCLTYFLQEPRETFYILLSPFPLDVEFKHFPTFFLKVESGRLELYACKHSQIQLCTYHPGFQIGVGLSFLDWAMPWLVFQSSPPRREWRIDRTPCRGHTLVLLCFTNKNIKLADILNVFWRKHLHADCTE